MDLLFKFGQGIRVSFVFSGNFMVGRPTIFICTLWQPRQPYFVAICGPSTAATAEDFCETEGAAARSSWLCHEFFVR